MEGQHPGTLRAFLVRMLLFVSTVLTREYKPVRVPVWSVTEAQASIFFPLMYAGWTIMLALFIYDEAAGLTDTAHAGTTARIAAVLLSKQYCCGSA